jgi:predicted MFS family arabinose efflux permease
VPVEVALRRARRATQGFFLLAGIAMASWAPMVPFAKARLALDDGALGLILLSLGLGSAAAMPLAGWLGHRHGVRGVLAIAGLLTCLALPLLALAPTAATLVAALLGFGAAIGVVDVAMNAHAVDVERRYARPLMSGFHALFSIGGLCGSAGMTGLLAAGVPLGLAATGVAGLLVVIVGSQWRALLGAHAAPTTADAVAADAGVATRAPRMPESSRDAAARLIPPRALVLGALCLVLFLAEGAMLDWSAVFLRAERGVAIDHAGFGYAAFSIAMASGRLLGDRGNAALGPRGPLHIVRWGSLLAAAGLALATLTPWPATAFAGFVLVGIGASNIVPLLFSAAGRVAGTTAAISLAIVTALGYAGLLAGPAAIGAVAHVTNLPLALAMVSGLLLVVALAAPVVLPRQVPDLHR